MNIPDSPYRKDSAQDQAWRLGYLDGVDREARVPGSPAAYVTGYIEGRRTVEPRYPEGPNITREQWDNACRGLGGGA